MNIFYVNKDPKIAAQNLCDKHVVKMILESGQMLCTAHHLFPSNSFTIQLFRKSFVNHPCTKWVCSSISNYYWLAQHALELCREYTFRYEKTHKSQTLIEWCNINIPHLSIDSFDEPPQCMPNECKVKNDTVTAYRNYYNNVKSKTISMKWTKRNVPEWYFNE